MSQESNRARSREGARPALNPKAHGSGVFPAGVSGERGASSTSECRRLLSQLVRREFGPSRAFDLRETIESVVAAAPDEPAVLYRGRALVVADGDPTQVLLVLALLVAHVLDAARSSGCLTPALVVSVDFQPGKRAVVEIADLRRAWPDEGTFDGYVFARPLRVSRVADARTDLVASIETDDELGVVARLELPSR